MKFVGTVLIFQPALTCSKLTMEIGKCVIFKIPEQRQWRRADIFIFNFEQMSHIVLVFSLLTLNK